MGKVFHITVADDDLDDHELIQEAFKGTKMKFVITKIYNGLQLLDYLLKRENYKFNSEPHPNLILLDLNMPLMDGFDVLREIRKHPELHAIPLYVITLSRNIDDLNMALDLGASGFYYKGSRSADISNIVNEVCNKSLLPAE